MPLVFKTFSSCPIVKGNKRDIIYDLGRNTFDFIPKSLTHFVKKIERESQEDIYKDIKKSPYKKTYKEYFDFLIEKEYAFSALKKIMKILRHYLRKNMKSLIS